MSRFLTYTNILHPSCQTTNTIYRTSNTPGSPTINRIHHLLKVCVPSPPPTTPSFPTFTQLAVKPLPHFLSPYTTGFSKVKTAPSHYHSTDPSITVLSSSPPSLSLMTLSSLFSQTSHAPWRIFPPSLLQYPCRRTTTTTTTYNNNNNNRSGTDKNAATLVPKRVLKVTAQISNVKFHGMR